jgi:membrane-associated phospholipid phosphatase
MTIETPYADAAVEPVLPVPIMARDWRAARWVSRIASPPLLAISSTMITAAQINASQTSGISAWWWASLIVLLTILTPSGYVFYLLKKGKVTDFDVYLRAQRFWPYIISILCAATSWLVLAVAHAPRLLVVLSGASVGQGVMMFLINQRWKISAHAAGTASAAIIIWQIFGAAGSPALLIIPLVGWSRVRLGRHSLLQVIAGALLGGGVFLGALMLWN